MVYLFYGTEPFFIKKEIEKIIKKYNFDAIQCSEYDLENDFLENVIEDAETISLFDSRKLIVASNANFLTGTTVKKGIEQNMVVLENYLDHPNPDSILIFLVEKEKLDDRKKIVKKLKQIATVKEFNQVANIEETIQTFFSPYIIKRNDLKLLIDRVGNNLMILHQEVEKIKIYKGDSLEITEQDILELTTKNIDTDLFHFIENIVDHKLEQALESYHEMIHLGEEPIKIIILLANQFRLIYQAKQLYRQGYSEKDIASELEIHPYRIKLALQKGKTFTDDILLDYLNKLADLDYSIKSGKIDKEIGLELFLIES